MKKILPLLALILLSVSLKATHVMGSELTYLYLGNGQYEITAKIYRDCNGIHFANSNFMARCGSNTVNLGTGTKVAINDITGVNGCSTGSRCANSSYQYGVEEHIWKVTLDLSSYSCCRWTISWEQCCRNSAITTGQSDQNFFVTAELNKCAMNSSPVFNTRPIRFLCKGEDVVYNMGLMDTVDFGDSFSFQLIPGNQGLNHPVSYNNSFSSQAPLTFLGFPNTNLPVPAGFHLNPVNGDLYFRPMQANEIAVMVIEVTEWKMVNGSWMDVGKIRRDMQVIVLPCNSNGATSRLNGPFILEVCPGDSLSIPFTTSNPDTSVKTWIEYGNEIPGAVFIDNNADVDSGLVKSASGTFHWKPDSSLVRLQPYVFSLRTRNNNCPLNMESSRAVMVFVRDSSISSQFLAGPDRHVGQQDTIQLIGIDVFSGGQAAYWKTLGDGQFSDSLNPLAIYTFGPNDKRSCEVQLLRISLATSTCFGNKQDTMRIYRDLGLFDAQLDSTGMNRDSAALFGIQSGNGIVQYWTSTGDGFFQDSSDMQTTYYFGPQDSANCGASIVLHRDVNPDCGVLTDTLFLGLPADSIDFSWSLSGPYGDTIFLSAYTSYGTTLNWTSSGNGTFHTQTGGGYYYIPDNQERGNGTLTLTLEQQGPCGTLSQSRSVSFLPTALRTAPGESELHIFPNPAEDRVTVYSSGSDIPLRVSVLELSGAVLMEKAWQSGNEMGLSLEGLAPGTYLIRVQRSSGASQVLRLQVH